MIWVLNGRPAQLGVYLSCGDNPSQWNSGESFLSYPVIEPSTSLEKSIPLLSIVTIRDTGKQSVVLSSGTIEHPMSSLTGIIIVDHGSRRRESNEMLHEATTRFAAQSEFSIVEAAHMELAEPSIAQAFDRCVERGATEIVVFPYFLSPGRHWTEDIPRLTSVAAKKHPTIKWLVTAPFGLHPGMLAVINDRIQHCRNQSQPTATTHGCDVCGTSSPCKFTTTT